MRPLAILAGIVGIFVCLAVVILIEAGIRPEIQKLEQKIDTLKPGEGLGDAIEDYHSLQITRAVVWGLGLVIIVVQVVCLISLTRSEEY